MPILSSLGPVTVQLLVEVGMRNESKPCRCGDGSQAVQIPFGKAVTLNALQGLDAAIRKIDLREIDGTRKAELKRAVGVV